MGIFETGYLGLFLLSFLAATLVPIGSEGMLLIMLGAGYDPWLALALATVGNTAGGATSYGIGRLGKPRWLKAIRVDQESIDRWQGRVERHGVWLALLAWAPLFGDVVAVALGFFRAPFWAVLALMALGKFGRYAALALPWIL
jgi:membrane protein YqaA with SNARE-associated domain